MEDAVVLVIGPDMIKKELGWTWRLTVEYNGEVICEPDHWLQGVEYCKQLVGDAWMTADLCNMRL